jgi:GT2 family glycosyltransferase
MPLTVGIATKDRHEEVARCIRSLVHLDEFDLDVVVIDDGSEQACEPFVRTNVELESLSVRFFRWESSRNLMAARNRIVREARHEVVLILDDDAFVVDGKEIALAIAALRADPALGAVAFSERNEDGSMKVKQPGKKMRPSFVTHFYGYAHVVKQRIFLDVGGYSEVFWFYHEESDYCKRALNRGAYCLYWPAAMVAHVPSQIDRGGRSLRRFRYGTRNRAFDSILNEPLPIAICSLVLLICKFVWQERSYRVGFGSRETGGPLWLISEIRLNFSALYRKRAPLRWMVFVQWKWLRVWNPDYAGASTPDN